MKAIISLALGLAVAVNAQASLNLITNASFESGLTGWSNVGSAARSNSLPGHTGTNALRLASRAGLTDGVQQDLATGLSGIGSGTQFVSRAWVKLDAPASVRLRLQMLDGTGSRNVLLAERMITTTNQWTLVESVQTVNWSGTLTAAKFKFEVGLMVEGIFPSFYLDDVLLEADADGDGLPDGWEVFNGTSAATNDAAADPDHDLASNWQEYWAATSPTNALSYPGRPRTNILSPDALAVLAYLAKLPSAPNNRVIIGQHVTDIEHDWSYNVATLPGLTGKWPGIVSFSAEGGAKAVPQMDKVIPRALEVWTNGGIPLIKFQFANPWTMTNTALVGLENITDMLRVAPTNITNVVARSNYLALRDNIGTNLAVLRDAGVVVLFRPLSEMNGGWFWHGSKRRAEYISLWRDLHDEFTFARGLTNLLWVYESDAALAHVFGGATNSSGTMVDYYFPGDDLVDIAGHNFYDDDWMLAFDSDAIWRRYGKVFAVPQAGKGSGQASNPNWSDLTYLTGISNTVPRSSFICVWNSFVNGTPVLHAISDNAQPSELMNAPWTVTRDEVNWRYELPFSLSIELTAPEQRRIHWQGGALQRSDDLVNWSEIPNAPSPYQENTTNGQGFFRLHRSY